MSLSRRSVMQSAVLGSVAALAGVAGSAQAKIKKPLPAQKVSEKRRVLIQSSSRYHTSGYLDFAGEQYEQLYGSSKHEILFIPENSYLRERCSQTREHPRFLFT